MTAQESRLKDLGRELAIVKLLRDRGQRDAANLHQISIMPALQELGSKEIAEIYEWRDMLFPQVEQEFPAVRQASRWAEIRFNFGVFWRSLPDEIRGALIALQLGLVVCAIAGFLFLTGVIHTL